MIMGWGVRQKVIANDIVQEQSFPTINKDKTIMNVISSTFFHQQQFSFLNSLFRYKV